MVSVTETKPSTSHARPATAPNTRDAYHDLLRYLKQTGYRFITPTPGTHTRVLARPDRQDAHTIGDVLGWSLPFGAGVLDDAVVDLLRAADALTRLADGRHKALIRVSSVYDHLFIHSAFPTDAVDSVFLGPDSYRFADYILAKSHAPAGARILDYGAGAGVGGITAASGCAGAVLTLADINPKALFLASVNAQAAGVAHVTVEASSPAALDGPFDLIVTHPPFMMDSDKRAYRDGGDLYGAQLSLDWVLAGVEKLAADGCLLLHTGISIVGGRDLFHEQIVARLDSAEWRVDYHELDPDIFSEDLDQPAYAAVDRIAAVGMCISRAERHAPAAG
jgi:methylase of polypeptide subunit release factors